jgi:predicted alpha/beta superfamily hydrolase
MKMNKMIRYNKSGFRSRLIKSTLIFLIDVIPLIGLHAKYTVDTIQIASNILNENRTLLIYKPAEIDLTDSVSIFYLLDGESSAGRFKKIQEQSNTNKWVAVGIVNTDRRRDLISVNEADKFLQFLSKEVMPKIETNSKIKMRILYGHSLAGGFTIHAFISNPELFDAYIASSPVPVLKSYNKELLELIDKELEHRKILYISCGAKDMRQVIRGVSRLHDSFRNATLKHISWKIENFEMENHNTSATISLFWGSAFTMHR